MKSNTSNIIKDQASLSLWYTRKVSSSENFRDFRNSFCILCEKYILLQICKFHLYLTLNISDELKTPNFHEKMSILCSFDVKRTLL